jgi:hypothetical protein
MHHSVSRPQHTEPVAEDTYTYTTGLTNHSRGHSTDLTNPPYHHQSAEHAKSKDCHLNKSTNFSKATELSKPVSALNIHHQSPMTTPPEAGPSEGAVGGATGPSLQPFHTQFIRNIVEDALDDFRDQIRQDILNLHTEVLKQFLVQQVTTISILSVHYFSRLKGLRIKIFFYQCLPLNNKLNYPSSLCSCAKT